MILDTSHLFLALLRRLNVSLVFDIGSRDGLQSLQIRESLPDAKIIAFEANPNNFEFMAKNIKIKDKNIEIFPIAITNFNGEVKFNVYKDRRFKETNLSGLSSIFIRDDLELDKSIIVNSKRLDDFVIDHDLCNNNIALWIDVEGADYQVLEGIIKIKDSVSLVHVEVETETIYKGEQKTKDELITLMNSYGFFEIGISFSEKERTFGNVVFINKQFVEKSGLNISYYRHKTFVFQKIRKLFLFAKNKLPFLHKKCKQFYIKYVLK